MHSILRAKTESEAIDTLDLVVFRDGILKSLEMVAGKGGVEKEFDQIFERMQSAKSKKAMKAAFNASPAELGRSAVEAATKSSTSLDFHGR